MFEAICQEALVASLLMLTEKFCTSRYQIAIYHCPLQTHYSSWSVH
jgi:hypothetical protein